MPIVLDKEIYDKGYILSDRGLKNIKHKYFLDFSNKKSLMKFLLN